MENSKRKIKFNTKIVALAVIALMLSIIVPISYAFFTSSVQGNTSASVSVIESGTMRLTLTDGAIVGTTTQWVPGDYLTKTFTVENTGTLPARYSIYLKDVVNNFVDKSDLVYEISSTSAGAYNTTIPVQAPGHDAKIISDVVINASQSHVYTLTLRFVNKSVSQNDNMNKSFSGKIQIYDSSSDVDDKVSPELYQGLVPVVYDTSGNTVVASMEDWYNYDEHKWANAVLVTNSSDYVNNDGTLKNGASGTTIPTVNIKQYYVWIPRYKYKLFNAGLETSEPEQMIEIEFQTKDDTKATGTQNGEWLTHPAFTFGSTELSGIWVGKFEPSHTTLSGHTSGNELACSNENCANAAGIEILPNKVSIVADNVANQFYASRSIENNASLGLNANQIDTHMMKNTEWGAVAYLSASKYGLYESASTCHNSDNNKTVTINGENVNRCEVWINNTLTGSGCGTNGDWRVAACGGTITGCSAKNSGSDGVQNSMNTCGGDTYNWNGEINNGRSSTTGNVYGVYDMSGGAWEYVMGNKSSSTTSYVYFPKDSGLSTAPNDRYFDKYLASTGADETAQRRDQKRGILGDATREIMKTYGTDVGGWFSDAARFVSATYPWFVRGGYAHDGAGAGVFGFSRGSGGGDTDSSFRIVLTAE